MAVNTDDLNTKIVRSDFDDMHANLVMQLIPAVEIMSYRLVGSAAPDRDQSVFDVLPVTGVLEQDPRVRTATFDVDGSSQCFEVVVMQRDDGVESDVRGSTCDRTV